MSALTPTGVDLGRCAQTADNDRAEDRTAHPDGAPDPFASSMRCAGELAGMLGGDDAMAMGHAELEDVIAVRGRELMRLLLQDHLAPSSGWRTGRRASPTCPADRGDFEPAGRAALVRDPQAQTSGSGSRGWMSRLWPRGAGSRVAFGDSAVTVCFLFAGFGRRARVA